jgi:exopolysaccharide biosynthesis WecB/TagA/CpsF family protein
MWQNRWAAIVDRIWIVRSSAEESTLLAWLASGTGARVLGFVNAHAMNSSADSEPFFDAITCSDVLLRDGAGMAILYRMLGMEPGRNMNGTDFIPRILRAYRGKRVALWGTTHPYVGAAAERCERQFGVRVVSCEEGFREFHSYLELARAARPALIVLGMGMPNQEQLARELKSTADAQCSSLIVCGGAVLDFLGGKVPRAPGWMRRWSIEWLYRLLLEPKRLAGRYLIGNPAFVFRLLAWRNDERFHRSWSAF